jgi:hypothetical protein
MTTNTWRPKFQRRRRLIARGSAAVLAACAVVASASPVNAAPLERGSFHDVGSESLEDFCGDLDVIYSFDVSGSFLVIARGPDGLVHFRDSVRGTEVFTNTETGRSYTGVFTIASRNLKVTDNGDGTLTLLIQGSGSQKWYDGDGKLVLRDTGLTRVEILVDHAGTPTDPSDDEFLEFLGVVKGPTGRNDTEGRDFCEDLILFTS